MKSKAFYPVCIVFCLALLVLTLAPVGLTQSPASSSQNPPPQQQKPGSQEPPPAAGGPEGDIGPTAIPQKKETPPEPPPPKPKAPEGVPDYSLRVDVPVVNVDVTVRTDKGDFIPGLKKENFRVLEDGVQQNINNFT